jgi:hypothetical protein
MLTINQLPLHLQGELYKHILDEYGLKEDTFIGRPIKTDFNFDTHSDILEMIDTCMFLAVDLPTELFQYVEQNKTKILTQMLEYDDSEATEKSFFVTTAEYRALKVLAEFETSVRFPRYSTYELAAHAIEHNSLVLLQYVCNRYTEHLDQCVIQFAISRGDIPIIEYLLELPFIKQMLSTRVLYQLCSDAPNLTVLKYFRETLRFPWDERLIEKLIYNKDIDSLRYALENGCPLFVNMVAYRSLRHSTVDALRVLVELAGYKPTDEDMLYVASRGSLDHLVYLRELGTPWHPHTVNSAARFRHTACMEYGIQHGAPYDPNIVELSRLPYRADIDRWMASIIYNE